MSPWPPLPCLVSQGEGISLIYSLFLPLASLIITVQLGLRIHVLSPTLTGKDTLSHVSGPSSFLFHTP